MDRRTLIKAMGALAPAAVAGRAWALSTQGPRLLVVFLRGAYDAANVVIPISSDFYAEARPTLAIARPGADANAALPLDADWGLHPPLRDTLWPLYQKGQAAFV